MRINIKSPHAVELYDMDSELLDNITISFETLDTCFCYGHCGCAVSCGSIKLYRFAHAIFYSVAMIRPTALHHLPWLMVLVASYGTGACLGGYSGYLSYSGQRLP